MSRLKRYFAAFYAWSSPSALSEETAGLTESLLPMGQLYGFEMSWQRARGYGEK
ncbi:hypothetical protein [Erwinia sp.]|uniref:hypothetical protein n=1 Tax=Erwinia citreus TaxID=558 RepID=UPI0028978EAD|nr:hypothetical protein [Erwinia sp.]